MHYTSASMAHPSCKEARRLRSTYARAASPLRNATSMEHRFAAVKSKKQTNPDEIYLFSRYNYFTYNIILTESSHGHLYRYNFP